MVTATSLTDLYLTMNQPTSKRRRTKVLITLIVISITMLLAASFYGQKNLDHLSLYAGDSTDSDAVIGITQRLMSVRVLHQVGSRLKQASANESEFINHVVNWTHLQIRPQFAVAEPLVSDNMLGIVVRGYGYCDQVAAVAATLLWTQGYQVRLLELLNDEGTSPHTALEVKLGERWVLLDPWLGTSFYQQGQFLSAHEISDAQIAYWGYRDVKARYFHRGRPWTVFPFLDWSAIKGRLLARLTGQAPAALPTAASSPVALQTRPPVSAQQRRAYVEARLAGLVNAPLPATPVPLPPLQAGALRFQQALTQPGTTPSTATDPWQASIDLLDGLRTQPPALSQTLYNAITLRRNLELGNLKPEWLPLYAGGIR